MDTAWSYEDWKDSSPKFLNAEHGMLSQSEFEGFQDKFKIHSTDLVARPYDAKVRAERAYVLYKLGYPELGVGDAYKALLSCQKFKQDGGPEVASRLRAKFVQESQGQIPTSEILESLVQADVKNVLEAQRTIHRQAYGVMCLSLRNLGALPDAIKMCQEGLRTFPGDVAFTEILEDVISIYRRDLGIIEAESARSGVKIPATLTWGSFVPKIYPWMPIEMCTRNSKAILKSANEMVKLCSENLEIRLSSIVDSSDTSPCFGMFAKKRVQKGEQLLRSSTALSISNRQTTGSCYNCSKRLSDTVTKQFPCCPSMQFCSEECMKNAEENYHKVMCGKDFTKIYEEISPSNLEIRMYLRLLAIFVQGGEHPLENQLMKWLAPVIADQHFVFTFDKDILAPIYILQELGADIYDAKYDFWVLFSVWNRIVSSRKGDAETMVADPMYSFFNHSCNPNAVPLLNDPYVGTSRVQLFAGRNIKEGEELFVTYLHKGTLSMPREQRSAELHAWMGVGGCKCEKCKAEE